MNQSTFYIIAAAAVLLALLMEPVSCNNSLSKKLRGLIDRRSRPVGVGYGPYGGYQAPNYGGYYNGGGSAAAASAAGPGSAAAAAAASNNGHHHHEVDPYANQYVDPYYGNQHNQYAQPAPLVNEFAYDEPQYYPPPPMEHHHHPVGGSGGSAAASAAAGAGSAAAAAAASSGAEDHIEEASNVAPVAVPSPQQFIPPQPPMPITAPRHRTRFGSAPMRVNRVSPGGGAAASSAAAGGAGGAAASAAAATSGGQNHVAPVAPMPVGYEGLNERLSEDQSVHTSYNPGEQVYAASSGAYNNNGNGHESSSYLRNTENVVKHEDGREDDNHYYQAQSYGKALDENKHEAYNNADEDIMQTAQMYRKKKTSTNWVSDYNKNQRESGSGVLAKDQHSSAYNKDLHRFVENVDKRHNSDIGGVASSSSASTSNNFNDEDESYFDSDGVGHPGYSPRRGPSGGAAASSAVGGGRGGSVATSASLNGGASSAAGK